MKMLQSSLPIVLCLFSLCLFGQSQGGGERGHGFSPSSLMDHCPGQELLVQYITDNKVGNCVIYGDKGNGLTSDNGKGNGITADSGVGNGLALTNDGDKGNG